MTLKELYVDSKNAVGNGKLSLSKLVKVKAEEIYAMAKKINN